MSDACCLGEVDVDACVGNCLNIYYEYQLLQTQSQTITESLSLHKHFCSNQNRTNLQPHIRFDTKIFKNMHLNKATSSPLYIITNIQQYLKVFDI